MPTISIIIPFFNSERYLEKCIENIKKQKYQDYEIILIDDGSIDNSKKIIKKYIDNTKIKYYYLEKDTIGVGRARNYGIEKADGKYIMFVDVDDYIDENLLSNLNKYINQGIELIKYKMKIIDLDQKEMKYTGPCFETISGEEAFNKLCFEDRYLDSPCLYLIKSELLRRENLKFEEDMYHEDFGLIPRLITKSKSVVSTKYYGYYYVQTRESIMRNQDYKKAVKKANDKFIHYKNLIKSLNIESIEDSTGKLTRKNLKIYYTNSVILSLKDLNKKDRQELERKIKECKMIENLEVTNIRQFIKKCILNISIDWYLKLIKSKLKITN
jgi:glycosyltransferase involved in cell wall biosynthesis